ncbi:DUF3027 domain-containing protein [Luteipulveratus mongoliensis]|uniref:DUF3027 domain-containing protein n=1 Tax=Luteipulveratus mongoliensis TaxID=571913 RepID=A0A0K1JML9_9MICO|nr:DUF3027 domain-containing protein [Luteipulveratus mongoliensis]AKU17961.1 hypothetical protein VV02_22345 [Luteipulveratus mongoliensis]
MAPKNGTVKQDKVLAAAVDLAREAAESIATPGTVGEHVRVTMDGERVATHYFECTSRAYPGWLWAVTVARVPRQKFATVSETNLVPGDAAMLSPEWLPYADRLAPGDIGPGDITAFVEADPLLEAGFEATGEEDVDEMAFFELGLGRPRVLSGEGRDDAAQRWYDGDHGPHTELAEQAPAPCSTCGYFVPMSGVLRQVFGVCASAWSPSDGTVVSLDHGCGAHSEADAAPPKPEHIDPPVLDEFAIDLVQ